MGFADLLIKLNIPYNSEEAILFTEKFLNFFSQKANDEICQTCCRTRRISKL